MSDVTMEKIVSLAKRRGFIFPGSEIYGGLSGTWDYGPMGVALKRNIQNLWWRMFVEERDDMFGIDAAILMNPKAWEASGHVSGFSDPLIECLECKSQFRSDHLIAEYLIEKRETVSTNSTEVVPNLTCPSCHKKGIMSWPKQFNMMFETNIGAGTDKTKTYLRPETAGGMFVNFKNVMDSIHPKLPFGLGQMGKAFRNEIAPRDFVFRSREFEQMEIEYFVHPNEWEAKFEEWRLLMHEWIQRAGIDVSKVSELEVTAENRAHYSKRTIDFEFEYPFGKKELYGLAYRTDFDLRAHMEHSGVDLSVMDEDAKEKFIPHVIEPSFGLERTVLAILVSAYTEDSLGENDRVFLKLDKKIAPIRAAVFPLLKNKPELVTKAREVYEMLKKDIPNIMWDDNGNVGKRYRRQDEIGTPHTITIDFDTLGESGDEKKDSVTVRDRDTGEQERVAINDLLGRLK